MSGCEREGRASAADRIDRDNKKERRGSGPRCMTNKCPWEKIKTKLSGLPGACACERACVLLSVRLRKTRWSIRTTTFTVQCLRLVSALSPLVLNYRENIDVSLLCEQVYIFLWRLHGYSTSRLRADLHNI